jgi:hypothetical protein
LTDQVDWDSALREDAGRVHAVGLFDLDRKIRPVGTAFKQLIMDWREVLPTQSVCLSVPIRLLDDQTETPSSVKAADLEDVNRRSTRELLDASKES